MDDSQRQLLEEPFRASLHRTRRGAHGRQLTYVETHAYIRRLNEALGGCWSYEIVEYKILDTEAVVLGRLSAGDVIKTAFGSSAISRVRETGETISLGDDLKAAASDALKKASSLLGLGLHLYGDDTMEPEGRREESPQENPTREGWHPHRVTERQRSAIFAISARRGIAEDALRARVVEAYGVPLDELSRREASELITRLNANGNGDNGGSDGNGKAAGGMA